MAKDDGLPPRFAPGSPERRPQAGGARPVGPDLDAARPHPRRQAGAVQRRSIREQPPTAGARAAAPTSPPPSYAPAPRAGGRPTATRPAAPSPTPARPRAAVPPPRARRRRRPLAVILVVLLLAVVAWPVGLLVWANGKIQHVDALSGAPNTSGTTYLLAGSDSRADGAVADPTEGQRSDTIMVLQVPASGPAALVSLPRDTYVEIPGHGGNKLNAAYSIGGAPLLVQTVEKLTGLTVDHYVEIGMGGVRDVVDAVGGVELCYGENVKDQLSGLNWTAGCHEADGATALAFARMRYADPKGDIGRAERQRQVIGAVAKRVATPGTAMNPGAQVRLLDAGTGALLVDKDTGIVDLARMAWAFRGVTGEGGLVGAPPIESMSYRPGGIGAAVLLDRQKAPDFFQRLRDGQLTAADFTTP